MYDRAMTWEPVPGPEIVILDGGLATELEARGCDISGSLWSARVLRNDPEAIERLQDEIRDYQEADAIGAYELRIRADGTSLVAFVTAEIADATRLAELRGLDTPQVNREEPNEPPS